ncbi:MULTISPECIES: hypothetical protein [unclassified Streptomyces]|uniref:hypothetical protein n=1 Tax=unclassified Streptomyces TaxID=2593676 RepID=UPI0006F722A0|nr:MULTISPECIES: hypothetical protein [unclassified Streptomyces]KQX59192.1 hypothetical protein ASD33_02520 [Streptomyces sp. Root1304]KRB00453.1 hypothetical protein ASE09_02520 [Streptomyces sp. Root66D1]
MNKSTWKRAGIALTAVAVVTGVAGCQDGDEAKKGAADAPAKSQAQTQSLEDVTKVIQAAYTKTSAAKSAKIRMTMEMPAGLEGGGTMEMTGVQGWDPSVMDLTVKGSMLTAGNPGGPEQMRMIMLGDAMYMDMGAGQAAETGGKRWMKLDLKAVAAASGDKGLEKSMTGGMENMNQDPSKQLAMLLDSPNLKHVGAEKVDGVDTQHYKGSLTLEQMVAANPSFDVLSEKDRAEMIDGVRKAGITAYDTQVWVNGDGYPVKMDVGMKTAQGTVKTAMHFSEYGAKASVQAPAAKDTVDLFEMLKGMGQG